jgi:hypothetical protein
MTVGIRTSIAVVLWDGIWSGVSVRNGVGKAGSK